MEVKFWGTRGSCPGSIKSHEFYGGNTSCISAKLAHDQLLVFDAGTGIRELGKSLKGTTYPIHLIFTHLHWDHIQGFPFFHPLYQEGREIHIYYPGKNNIEDNLKNQMDGIRFPLTYLDIKAKLQYHNNFKGLNKKFNCKITEFEANHVGECYVYKLSIKKKSLVYAPDNQLHEGVPYKRSFKDFVKMVKNCSLLIHDTQFLSSDMPQKKDWGHSIASDVQRLGKEGKVKHLVYFHHDPDRDDESINAIVRSSTEGDIAAYDGLELHL